MIIAGVAIDTWKLAIFKKHLDAAGYVYTEHPGIVKNTLFLRVETDFVATLQPIIEKANAECRSQ